VRRGTSDQDWIRVRANNHLHDVIVIGAGPAGLMAASDLARQGYDVVVLEEHEQVGQPVHCTGVLGYEAFDELDLPRQSILMVTGNASFRHGAGEPVLVETDRVIAAVVDRGVFDQTMAARAIAAGAVIRTSARVDALVSGDALVSVTVRDADQPVRGRACVLACGASYRFNQELGLGVPRAHVQTAQIDTPFPALPRIDVRLGRAFAPGGFAWAVPFTRGGESRARLGLFCEDDAVGRFTAFRDQVAAEAGVDPSTLPTPRLKMMPLGPVKRTVASRLIAVGDAAGMVKPTTGGGIYYSLLSGRIAAETLDGALRRDALLEKDLRPHEDRWRERLGADIRIGLAFRAIAARIGDRGIHALVELARVDGILPLLKETADFNWHRRAALALLRHPSFRRVVLSSFWN
jgi:digeranylgeranylglycerophospholipid reductase